MMLFHDKFAAHLHKRLSLSHSPTSSDDLANSTSQQKEPHRNKMLQSYLISKVYIFFSLSFQGELRPLYLQLNPSKTLLARALVKVLVANRWQYASLIIEDTYANDGFLDTFIKLTPKSQDWHVKDKIVLSTKHTDQEIDDKLQYLLENRSRLLILHCSVALARRVFHVARYIGLITEGYAWFVTEDVVTKDKEILKDSYPIGLVAFALDINYLEEDLIADAVKLISLATDTFSQKFGYSLDGHVKSRDCITSPTLHQENVAGLYYRYVQKQC